MGANLIARLWHFPRKPWIEQRCSILYRIYRWIPGAVVPIRLPFGALWLAQYDYTTQNVLYTGYYEELETKFVGKILGPGMTMLDIGANRGYYTLLASRRVGPCGRVVAFEPSPRERRFLKCNLVLNRCKNVAVEPMALGSRSGEANLYVVARYGSGCNSLRPPDTELPVATAHVSVSSLDDYLRLRRIDRVDFVKMDIEGGELDVLKGATTLTTRGPRPVFLCELLDKRTRPWGYRAQETLTHLEKLGFRWFSLSSEGRLGAMPGRLAEMDGNFVAVPEERAGDLRCEGWL